MADVYKENFDLENSRKGDLELTGLGSNLDAREERLRAFKVSMVGWRPLALPVAHFLQWDQPYNPAIIVGANTLFFLLIWYLNLSVLSTLAVLGTVITFADGVIPVLSTTILDTSHW